jgi:putative iron-only hydrogenase system regulator
VGRAFLIKEAVMEKRIGVIGIVIEEASMNAAKVNAIIGMFRGCIVGRMGVPFDDEDVAVISLIVEVTTEELGSLTGKLGSIKGVIVKSAITTKTVRGK